MALIIWNSGYSVGNEEIDTQHQKLIEIINTLHDAMRIGKGKEIIEKVLDELTNYTIFHFAIEEKLFDLHKYPGSLIHKKNHSDLVAKVIAFKENYFNGSSLLTLDLMNFLKDWLVNHIAKSDKEYTAFFIGKGVFEKK